MTIEEVLQSLENRRKMYGIEEFKKCLDEMHHPQKQLKCVHITGTNGKGSTANYIYSALKKRYKVGLFTSPYLVKHNDRIRINDEWISDEQILTYYHKYNVLWEKYELSSFEIDMFMAIMYFIEQKVEICVFEVGLGGMYDATNVIDSLVSVITNVDFDHQMYLGDSLQLIAEAKAGIIKPNSVFITMDKNHLAYYQKICEEKNTTFVYVPKFLKFNQTPTIQYQYKQYNIQLKTIATYQVQNSVLAINVLEQLQKYFPLSKQEIEDGISQAFWNGRCQIVCDKPTVLIDGAHNVSGIKALLETLKPLDNVVVLFSAVKDKNYHEMLKLLKSQIKEVYVTTFDFERAMSIEQLAQLNCPIVNDIPQFIKTHASQTIVICGSLYFISDLIKKGVIYEK